MERADDFEARREHLSTLSERELEERFWKLTEQLVDPMLELARSHTSPSIERSVLLRMGFSSAEAKSIVEKTIDHELIGKGAGHVVYAVAARTKMDIRSAGLKLAEGELWEEALASFGKSEE
jgi:D-ornithine 4,5-aminomutase subunit alpha